MDNFKPGDKIEFIDNVVLAKFLRANVVNKDVYNACFTEGIAEIHYLKKGEVYLVTRKSASLVLEHELKYFKLVEKAEPEPMSATALLQQCVDIQQERGKQYDGGQQQERSFQRVATAFNAITHRDLKGSDVALMLQILKDVRLYTNMDSLHEDSVLDKISYASLHGEELYNEFKENNC